MDKHPAYRLIDGRIMYQLVVGGYWIEIDTSISTLMLKLYDGIDLKSIEKGLVISVEKENMSSEKNASG